MTKDSIFVGAVNNSSFKNGGTKPSGSCVYNSEPGYAQRTKSPRAFEEVIKTKSPSKIQKPTKG